MPSGATVTATNKGNLVHNLVLVVPRCQKVLTRTYGAAAPDVIAHRTRLELKSVRQHTGSTPGLCQAGAENDRTHGHVSAMGVYDPVTASDRPLGAALVREPVTERIQLLPPCGGDWPVCRSASTIRYGLTETTST
jgi:hypothetical protein